MHNAIQPSAVAVKEREATGDWLDNHRDYLPATIEDTTPIPVYGVRMVVSIGADGRPAISASIDNPVSLNRLELAGALDFVRRRVLAAQEQRIVEYPPNDH